MAVTSRAVAMPRFRPAALVPTREMCRSRCPVRGHDTTGAPRPRGACRVPGRRHRGKSAPRSRPWCGRHRSRPSRSRNLVRVTELLLQVLLAGVLVALVRVLDRGQQRGPVSRVARRQRPPSKLMIMDCVPPVAGDKTVCARAGGRRLCLARPADCSPSRSMASSRGARDHPPALGAGPGGSCPPDRF